MQVSALCTSDHLDHLTGKGESAGGDLNFYDTRYRYNYNHDRKTKGGAGLGGG